VLVTFGCRLNTFESEVMRRHAREAGLKDVIIVQTCAVTAEAERQARQAIRRVRRQYPGARIVVTGCAAQIDPGRWLAMPEVDQVVGNHDKLRPETWQALAAPASPRLLVSDISRLRELAPHMVEGFDGRTRAFVQVQQGCDHRCTFCIIPYGRGPSRSLPIAEVVAQTRKLVATGYREVVLTGVDLTSFGRDLPDRPSLGRLVRAILREVPELPRLRLSSIDPAEVDDELRAAFAEEERLMPHLHLSVQAGDDLILKRMKRRHLRADVLRLVRELRELRPDLVFGADLIAGFPTESEAMFARTLALVEEAELVFLHVFPYSPRPGTPAARMPQLPVAVRRERAARLRALGEALLARFLQGQIGSVRSLLVERDGTGHTEHFARAQLDPPASAERGQIVAVRVVSADGSSLIVRAEP
jgi:threonylcarbamoyladenosine tRNA methylthiotransferase MtaB